MSLVTPWGRTFAALRNAANAAKVDCGSASVLDNLSTLTVMYWLRNSSLASGRELIRKRSGGTGGWEMLTNDGVGNLKFGNDRNTTNLSYITSSTPLVPSGGWKLIAATKDQSAGAGLLVHIYRGDLTTPATECTYGTQTDGTGVFKDESSQPLQWWGDGSFGLVGDAGPGVLVNRVLSLVEIRAWQADPTRVPAGAVGHWLFGQEGTGLVLDRSGNANHGTITSLIPVAGLTLPSPRLRALVFAVRVPVVGQFRVAGMMG